MCTPEPMKQDLLMTRDFVPLNYLKLSSAHLMGPRGISSWGWGAGHPDLEWEAAGPLSAQQNLRTLGV